MSKRRIRSKYDRCLIDKADLIDILDTTNVPVVALSDAGHPQHHVAVLIHTYAEACTAHRRSEPRNPRTEMRFWRVRLMHCGRRKINCIKAIRAATGVSLKTAKNISETPGAAVIEDVESEARARAVLQALIDVEAIATIERHA